MRVLVTGATGQLGSELVEAFAVSGTHEVIATDRATLDVTDRDAVLQAVTGTRPDAVVHAAAFTAVDDCETDPDRAWRTNALGTRHVADGARRVGAHVCYVSSDYVFAGDQPDPYTEWHATGPRSVYGRSKLGGERELDPGATVVRTSWLSGRRGPNMVKTVLRLAEGDAALRFVDDQRGCPTFADDLASMVCHLVTARLPGLFHVTNQEPTTWYGFAREVLTAAGHDPSRVSPVATADLVPARPAPRPANSVLDNAALRLSGLPLLPDHRESLHRLVKELTST